MKARFAGFALAGIFFAATPFQAIAQGCSLCRDTTAGSAPQARKALRRAIPLLGVPAIGIFVGTLVLAARIKPGQVSGEEQNSTESR